MAILSLPTDRQGVLQSCYTGHFDGFNWSALYSFKIKQINTKEPAIVFQLSYKTDIGQIISHTLLDLYFTSWLLF